MRVALYAELELDGMLIVEAAVPKQQPFGRHLARQELLRQRRPLIRQQVLVADQDETPGESFAAQRCRRPGRLLVRPRR